MNQIQSIGNFMRTSKGYRVTAPEGYVAVDKVAGAVKLVDRLESKTLQVELMITIPDLIDNIKKKFIRILDCYYSIIESIGVRMKLWLE